MSGQVNDDKHHFTTKGKNAEQVLSDLAHQTFLADWCFLNPRLPNRKELCDLLVVFDDIAIIWQVKDLKLDNNGNINSRKVHKNLRQLSGARRQMFEIKTPIELYNPRRKREVFDPSSINEVHLISALIGEERDAMNMVETINNQSVHVFTKAFLPVLLEELDTIRDFSQYLAAREVVVSENRVGEITGGEQDLLAYYLMHDRSFGSTGKVINISQGLWVQFRNSSAYQRKKEADTMSYYWDAIINRVHECRDNPRLCVQRPALCAKPEQPNTFCNDLQAIQPIHLLQVIQLIQSGHAHSQRGSLTVCHESSKVSSRIEN